MKTKEENLIHKLIIIFIIYKVIVAKNVDMQQ